MDGWLSCTAIGMVEILRGRVMSVVPVCHSQLWIENSAPLHKQYLKVMDGHRCCRAH
jgi:hypothetical protein